MPIWLILVILFVIFASSPTLSIVILLWFFAIPITFLAIFVVIPGILLAFALFLAAVMRK
jgi:hypothetical protein